jgi:dTDP-4-dehydrorhamnose reductase
VSAGPNRVGVTGASGMLGREIVRVAQHRQLDLAAWNRAAFDVTDRDATLRAIVDAKPDVVIHAGAWTDVDGCEADPKKAFLVNGRGTGHVVEACRECGARLVYVSTDYVFSGDKPAPYVEDDEPGPLSVYGWSKLVGEELVRSLDSAGVIARTAWVYADHGKNFYLTMSKLAETKHELRVVNDQTGCPTFAADLAVALLDLAMSAASGTFHTVNQGAATWNRFARKIFAIKNRNILVRPVTSDEFPRPAKRPSNSVLRDTRMRAAGIAGMAGWEAALARCMARGNSELA